MQTTLPAVQKSCRKARKMITYSAKIAKKDKRNANRRYHRKLSEITRSFYNIDKFDNESFTTPSFSSWDIC